MPDGCDFDAGTSDDCNQDGIPDECPLCPPLELVFIMDTSQSMDGEASALCGSMASIVTHLESAGLSVDYRLLGICDLPGGAYACLEDHVANLLGTVVPGDPPAGLETLGDCPGGNQICTEDWGLATAVVAGLYPWSPEGESLRMVIPLFDEGAWCGDPVTDEDDAAVNHATAVAVDNGVIVSPITGAGSSADVIAHAEAIATITGGSSFSSSEPDLDLADGILAIVLDACFAFSDCNGNGVLDVCDLAAGTSLDVNLNGVPDECELVAAEPATPNAKILSVVNHPNPFNPRTVISFDLAAGGDVDLDVYDLSGARVRTLLGGAPLEAGRHEAVWRGDDDKGRRVSAGVYVYRLRMGSEVKLGRMALIK